MRPKRIHEVMDLAKEARAKGLIFNPLFSGEAGLGKSEIVKQWVKQQKEHDPEFGFIDLRIAYMEAPDFIGFPESVIDEDKRSRTAHLLPEFWPTKGSGLLLLEEPNRGTTGVMNCLMQILTDRKVHNYTLPDGWIIAGCINPDQAEYDVNSMDVALKDRFEEFPIDYDHNTFVEFMDKNNWDQQIQFYVKSGAWTYKESGNIGKEGKYISPRTWSKLNAAEIAGARGSKDLHRTICLSVLGKDIGNEYWKFCWDQSPVMAADLIKDKKAAIKRLEKQCEKDSYEGEKIAVTVQSIVKNYGGVKAKCAKDQVDEETMADVARVIPSDQALVLIKECGFKVSNGQVTEFFKEFVAKYPDLVKVLKDNIKINRSLDKK
jgi:hypothetical protein